MSLGDSHCSTEKWINLYVIKERDENTAEMSAEGYRAVLDLPDNIRYWLSKLCNAMFLLVVDRQAGALRFSNCMQ